MGITSRGSPKPRRNPCSVQVCGPADPRGMEAQQEQHHSGISMDFALFGRNLALFQLQERRKKGCGVFSQSPSPGEAALVSPDPWEMSPHSSRPCWGSALGSFPSPAIPSLECSSRWRSPCSFQDQMSFKCGGSILPPQTFHDSMKTLEISHNSLELVDTSSAQPSPAPEGFVPRRRMMATLVPK